LAYQYIEKHRKSEEEDERVRIDLLKFLLFNLKENPDDYVYTEEILDNLNAIRVNKIKQHYFRSNIVSKLRDQGLLIASSNKGYKLPVCLNDLYDFVNLSSLTIHPMIQRIAKCRDQILLATNREIDILEKAEYDYLKRVIEMEKRALLNNG
jgi:biotin operon repressor